MKPSEGSERINELDIVRGFALFGIFLVNMPAFFLPILLIDPYEVASSGLDKFVVTSIDIFARTNFYTLFSFLFGLGTIMFYERAKEKGSNPLELLRKRFFLLLVFGLIHAFLIWHGDILITYAIVGFIFMLFLNKKSSVLLKTALSLILIPSVLFASLIFLAQGMDQGTENKAKLAQQVFDTYKHGTYVDITVQRVNDWLYVHGGMGMVFVIVILLPMFLLGGYFAKEKLFHHPREHIIKLKKIAIFSFIIGIPLKVIPVIFPNEALLLLQQTVGGPAMAVGYATLVVLLVQHKVIYKVLSPLRYVGRLSLSNYIFQSVFCTLIFYSYGLGFYGEVSFTIGLLLNLLIFTLQITLSKWWLTKYNYGPLEWVWRSFTYGKKLSQSK